LRPDAEHCT